MRDTLQKEQAKIEVMKGELQKSQWRKTAGEILTTELEKHVEEMVKKSAEMQIGHWELGDLGSNHIRNIDSELK